MFPKNNLVLLMILALPHLSMAASHWTGASTVVHGKASSGNATAHVLPGMTEASESHRHQVCEIQFFLVPPDITVTCSDLPVTSEPILDHNSNCCEPVSVTYQVDTLAGSCPTLFRLVRRWTAMDECGNSASTQQSVTVRDLTPPQFTLLPANVTVSCNAVPPPPVIGVDVQAIDDCGNGLTITGSSIQVPGVCPQQYLIIRTWIARDACQNSTVVQRTVLVQDHQAPVFINPPQDLTLHCLAPVPPVDTIIAEDNCSDQVWFTFNESLSGFNYCNTLLRVRTWTAEDMCGNRSTHTQTIVQTDAGPPVFSNVPGDTTAECGQLPTDSPSISDDCDPDPQLNLSSAIIPGNCPGNYTLIRTWLATDDCGNVATTSQTIQVSDTNGPVISFNDPALAALNHLDTMFASCEAEVIFGVDDATVVDACDLSPQVIFIDSLIFDDGCRKLLYCEWRATDHCGNVSSFIFYMAVGDFTGPVIGNVPPDVTITCSSPIPPLPFPTVEDDCDLGPKLNLVVDTLPGPCPQRYQLVRTWTARDFCGNTTTARQTITVTDNQSPVLNAVDPLLIGKANNAIIPVQCGNEPVFSASSFVAVDNCDPNPTITLQSSTAEANCLNDGYLRQITYTWTASDACGNTSAFTVRIRVTDNVPPVFTTFPPDQTVECDVPVPFTSPTATDACAPPVTITHSEASLSQPCGFIIERTWTATDACGNSTSRIQRITVRDTKPPVLTGIPADLTIACDLPLPAPPMVSATDNCDSIPQITLQTATIPGNCPGNHIVVRTWTVTDNCGNTATASQRISRIDTIPPVFVQFPADTTVSCEEVPDGTQGVAATDNCSPQVLITITDNRLNGSCPDQYFLVRTFVADDGCGNTSTRLQKILVVDEKAPVFVQLVPELTIQCDAPLPQPAVNDNCDPNPVVTSSSELLEEGDCTGEYLLLVTWTATDRCGNSTTATQRIQVIDTVPPAITPVHPAIHQVPHGTELVFECSDLPTMDEDDVAVTDACDPSPKVSFHEAVTFGDCPVDGFLYRLTCTWKALDDCGNESSYTVYLKVVDTKAPLFDQNPADITVDAKNGEQVPPPATISVTDNCDTDPEIVFTETSAAIDCGYILTRTWITTDHCGNSAVLSQRITVLEGCPCVKPQVTLLDVQHPRCGRNDGSIRISVDGDAALFQYVWVPNKGVANNIGNERSGLSPGEYQIFIQNPVGGASCFTKLTVNLAMQWDCLDTIHISTGITDPLVVCVDSVLDLTLPPASAGICAIDSQAIASVVFNLPSGCLTIDPVDAFTGTTTLCIIHCDDQSPPFCDTTILIIQVNGIQPCEPLFSNSALSFDLDDCSQGAWVCLPASPVELSEYKITLNNQAFPTTSEGCDFVVRSGYDLSNLPGGGTQGPYLIESWTVQGQFHSGAFQTIEELLTWMNLRDPAGNWTRDGSQIRGGSGGSAYGNLVIRQAATNILISLGVQALSWPRGTRFQLTEGNHFLRLEHVQNGCSEEVFLTVLCADEPEELIAVTDSAQTLQSQAVFIPILSNDLIPGGAEYVGIRIAPANGQATVRPDFQILYVPRSGFCGEDRFTYEVCNLSACDQAEVIVQVACAELVFYNGFSPNGDGINDRFIIGGVEAFPENELIITNRWGNEVYRQMGYKNQWGGTWNGNLLPDGTYFYLFFDGTGRTFNGYVQVQR
jgi:gliding motility-associated-like protein